MLRAQHRARSGLRLQLDRPQLSPAYAQTLAMGHLGHAVSCTVPVHLPSVSHEGKYLLQILLFLRQRGQG